MEKDIIAETKAMVERAGYTKEDIQWIGGHDFTVPINNFWDSTPQYYDNGYGCIEVPLDLTVVFKDGTWLERFEYDGSEGWKYKKCPNMPLRINDSARKFTLVDVPFNKRSFDGRLRDING